MASAAGDGAWVDVSDVAARTRRSGATATLWRDTVIFIGGRNRDADGGEFFTEVLSFSFKDRTWTSLGDMPFAGRAHHTATLVPGAADAFGVGAEDEIWVLGGTDARRLYGEARVYTPATGEWRDETPFLTGAACAGGGARELELLRRAAHGCAALPAAPWQLLLHAGASASGGYLDDVAMLDTRARKVSTVPPARGGGTVPLRRGYHVFAALGPYVVVFGGRAGDGEQREQLPPSETFKVYDPTARRWLPTRAAGTEPAARWHAAAAALPPAPGGGTAGALLLHGGVAAGAARLGDAHVLRCSGAGHALTWHALRGATPPPRSHHAAAAAWAPGAPPGGAMRLLFAGGGATDAARHFTLCGDAFMLHLPRPPWDEPAAAPREAPRAPAAPSQPPAAPAPAHAADNGDGADDASQWRKRPRGNAAATVTAHVSGGGAGGRRAALPLAPAADVRAAEAAAATEERTRRLEADLESLRVQLAAANAGWSEKNAALAAAQRGLDAASGETAALRSQLADEQAARRAAQTAAARATGEARAAVAARDAAAHEAAEARSAAADASMAATVATSRADATAQVAAEEREKARKVAEELRGALAAADGKRAAAEERSAALTRAAEDARAALADAHRERDEAGARGAEAVRDARAQRDAVTRERDALRTARADAEKARDRALDAAENARARATDAEAAARAAERAVAEQRTAFEAERARADCAQRALDDARAELQLMMPRWDALCRIMAASPQQQDGRGADAGRRVQQDWRR